MECLGISAELCKVSGARFRTRRKAVQFEEMDGFVEEGGSQS